MTEKTSLGQARDKAMAIDASPQDKIAYFVAERNFWAKVRDERGESDEDQYVETIFGSWFTMVDQVEFYHAPEDYTPEEFDYVMKEIEQTVREIIAYEAEFSRAIDNRDVTYYLAANYSFYNLIKGFAKGV